MSNILIFDKNQAYFNGIDLFINFKNKLKLKFRKMKDPNTAPLFYVDNLQKTGSDEYTVELILPENFNYEDYEVIGNSQAISEILKIQLIVTGDRNEDPSPISKTVPVTFNLKEGETGSYFKFQIVWVLPVGSSVGVGDPEDRETVGEGVLKGMA